MKNNLKFIIIASILGLFLCSHNVFADELRVATNKQSISLGEVFEATILVDTENESINAIEGEIVFDDKILKLELINTAQSFVNFWVEDPILAKGGSIRFSGITPGGINAHNIELFKISFRAQIIGKSQISINNIKLFINDGAATMSKANSVPGAISITPRTAPDSEIEIVDFTPPEKFKAERAKNIAIYDNKWFAVFNTADKTSGIKSYEICELWRCNTGVSPYQLSNQSPFYLIEIIAYDNNGNKTSTWIISKYLIGGLILMLILFLAFIFSKYRKYI